MLAHDLPTCGRSARDLAEGLVVTNGRSSAHSLPQPQGLPRVWTGGSAQDRVTARSVSALRRCSPTTNCGYARAVRRAVAGPAGRIPGPARDRRGRAPGPRPARRPPPGCLTQVATSTWTRPVTAACWAHLQGMEAGACSARQERARAREGTHDRGRGPGRCRSSWTCRRRRARSDWAQHGRRALASGAWPTPLPQRRTADQCLRSLRPGAAPLWSTPPGRRARQPGRRPHPQAQRPRAVPRLNRRCLTVSAA